MRSRVLGIVLCALAVSIAGCSTTARFYDGEPRPASEIATLIPGFNYDVAINRVNGKHNFWQRVEVEAGYHTIEGTCMPNPDDDYCPTGEVSAYLEAGKTYILEASTIGMGDDCLFYVEEAGDPLAGRIRRMLSH